jgi:magnesium-dependent phosphatase 1
LKKDRREDYIIAWVSTCDYPDWGRECLSVFKTLDGESLDACLMNPACSLLYHANKRNHFQKLKSLYPEILYEEMIFFDNQMNNIRDVSVLGVNCIYCPDGLTKKAWEAGRKIFPCLPSI